MSSRFPLHSLCRPLAVMFCALTLLAALACQKQDQAKEQPAAAKRLQIAVIPKGTTHEFWKAVHAGAVQAAKEMDVDIIWKGPLKEDDREAQIKVVEDFINRGVSGIVLAPLDDTALRAPVASAKNSGIPVVVFDSDLQGGDYVSFVATDNVKGGQLAGEYMGKLLGGKGNVAMLRYAEGSASTTAREQGFSAAVAKMPGIKIVSDNQYGGATTESAYQASENMLARFKSPAGELSLQGIFCPNESTTFGMLRTLQDGRFAEKVVYVGFDSSDKLIEGLKAGQIKGLVLQNPQRMGYLGVKTLVQSLRGQQVEKRIDTGATLVTLENINQPEIQQLLKPDLKKWLGE